MKDTTWKTPVWKRERYQRNGNSRYLMSSYQIRFYALPEIHDIRLVHGNNVTHRFPRHIHQSVVFGIIVRGQRSMEIRGETFIVSSGECFVLNAGEPHVCDMSPEYAHEYWALSVKPDVLRFIAENMPGAQEGDPYFLQTIIQDQKLFRLMQEFAVEVQYGGEPLAQESLFLEIVTYCLTRYARLNPVEQEDIPYRHTIQAARDYLEQHFEQHISLEELARIAHASPFYLNRIFRQEVGIPPYEYLVHVRIKHAQQLLEEGKTIAEAAYLTGFSDQSHLTRFFKRHVGISPGEYFHSCHV